MHDCDFGLAFPSSIPDQCTKHFCMDLTLRIVNETSLVPRRTRCNKTPTNSQSNTNRDNGVSSIWCAIRSRAIVTLRHGESVMFPPPINKSFPPVWSRSLVGGTLRDGWHWNCNRSKFIYDWQSNDAWHCWEISNVRRCRLVCLIVDFSKLTNKPSRTDSARKHTVALWLYLE